MVQETQTALHVLSSWTATDAYAWCMALRAKAFRLLDKQDQVLRTVDDVLAALAGDEQVVAHLELERGMCLNQFGHHRLAVASLDRSQALFDKYADPAGRAWALVSLAEAHCGSGYGQDPEPMLMSALDLATKTGDDRAVVRAWKQLAVVHRHRGRIDLALHAVKKALDGPASPHARANYTLEYGHLLAWSGDLSGADAAYEEAAVVYLEHGDELGLANVERALAHNALVLGRFEDGIRRLDAAATHYKRGGYQSGIGYVLRERSSVLYARGDLDGAEKDANDGLRAFRNTDDTLGLAGMLNTAARLRHRLGDPAGAHELLEESLELSGAGDNPLALANALTLRAELEPHHVARACAATQAAELFAGMRVWTGAAMAHAAHADSLAGLQDADGALAAFHAAAQALRKARVQVVDPGRRADHDFALRDVTTKLLTVGASLSTPAAAGACADLLVDDAPLGLRAQLSGEPYGPQLIALLDRVGGHLRPSAPDRETRRNLRQQLAAAIATINTGQDHWVGLRDLAQTHATQAVLVLGAPQHDATLPIASVLPDTPVRFARVPLKPDAAEQLDALGHPLTAEDDRPLWDPDVRSWQRDLTDIVLPTDVQNWILHNGPLAVLLPPVLAHLPIEALLVDDIPVGIRSAITRIPAPSRGRPGFSRSTGSPALVNAYFDPALRWSPEKSVVPDHISDAGIARDLLGPDRVTVIGSHGVLGSRLEATLVSTAGQHVIDALDLLRQPLDGSVLVLESCHSGRHHGHRSGEQLTLATAGLVAGASAVLAGLFALPADDGTTGVIAASLVRQLSGGIEPAEALRQARFHYWQSRPARVPRPGDPRTWMPGDAPWAWSGLVAFGR